MRNRMDLVLSRYVTIIDVPRSLYIIAENKGKVIRIDKSIYTNFSINNTSSGINISQIPMTIRNMLISQGILIPKRYDEITPVVKLLFASESSSVQQNKERSLGFFLSNTCNFQCKYCIQGVHKSSTNPNYLTFKQIQSALSHLPTIFQKWKIKKEPTKIILLGGEPLLPETKDSVEFILKYAKERSLNIVVITNGYYYDSFAPVFLSKKLSNTVTFLVSLDGPSYIHNLRRFTRNGGATFSVITKNISMMLESGFSVVVQPILDKNNVNYLGELHSFIKEKGWFDYNNFSVKCGITMFPNVNKKPHFLPYSAEEDVVESLLRWDKILSPHIQVGLNIGLKSSSFLYRTLIVKEHVPIVKRCSAGSLNALSFSPDGMIYACHECVGLGWSYAIAQFAPELKFFDETLESWRSQRSKLHSSCLKCKHILLCGGGCRILHESSDNNSNNLLCPDYDIVWPKFLRTYDDIYHANTLNINNSAQICI